MKLRFIILFVVISNVTYSQKESNIWYFGNYAGITFSTNPPTALTDGQMKSIEGCATICDKNGNLLFYTNGVTIWNKNHCIMDNGTGLNGHVSSSQSSIIVPKPANNKIYYVFTIDAGENKGKNGLQYSEIDISMNGGTGKVINKNIELIKYTAEKITVAKHYNKMGYWVITRSFVNNIYYSYLVTSKGIDTTPVISHAGNSMGVQGYLKVSNDNKKLVSAGFHGGPLELFDFDNLTGIVFNTKQIDINDEHYGVEFSPNNKKLYVSIHYSIYQYDLLSTNISNSKKLICVTKPPLPMRALQIGLNKKIYYSKVGSNFLGVINKPDEDSCNLVEYAINLGGRNCQDGLPNIIPSLIIIEEPPVASFTVSDTIICQGENVNFTNTTIAITTNQKWLIDGLPFDTNKNTSYTFKKAGNYTISLIDYKDSLSDTTNIGVLVYPTKQTTLYSIICQGDTFNLGTKDYTTTGTYYDTFTTYSGCDSIVTTNLLVNPIKLTTVHPVICEGDTISVGSSIYTISGTYYDTLKTNSGCDSIITTNLQVNNLKRNFLPPDTAVCFDNGEKLQLDGGNASEYLWYPSLETGRYLNIISEGIYNIVIKDSIGCESTDSIRVYNVCGMTLFVPNAFVPNGINIVFKAYGVSITHIELKVFSRWGELIFEGNGREDTFWDGKCHNELCTEGAYYYSIKASGRNGETKELYGLVHLLR